MAVESWAAFELRLSPLWQILSEIYHKKAHKEQEAAAANNSINVNIASDKKKGSCC